MNDCEKTPVRKHRCMRCGEPILPLPQKMVEKIYGREGDQKGLSRMCPKCRRKVLVEDGAFKR